MKNKIIVFLSVLSFIIGGFFFNTNTSSAETSSTDYVPNQLIVKFKQNASLSNVQSFHKSVGANVLSKDDKLGFEVVQFSKGTVKEKIKSYKNNPDVNMQNQIITFTPFGLQTTHILIINMDYKRFKLHKLGIANEVIRV